MKVGSDNKKFNQSRSQIDDQVDEIIHNSKDDELVDGFNLHVNQWNAMFKKRYYSWINSWHLFLIQNIILILFIMISVIFAKISKEFYELPKLEINLNTYGENVAMLQTPLSNVSSIDR